MISFPAALLLALLTLIVGLVIGFAAGHQKLLRASMGEALLANSITVNFTRPQVLLNNVTLPTESGTTQIDHILIADIGFSSSKPNTTKVGFLAAPVSASGHK